MKKVFFLFVLLNLCFSTVCDAGINVDEDPIVKDQKQNTSGPKGILPSVSFLANGDILDVAIYRYLGSALISVFDQDGNCVNCSTYYINGVNCCSLDFTGYEIGSYSISVALQNGLVYSGAISLE
ncbi:MAG: hypothetical protein MJZ73_06485 [Bacteroidaceae bacterium]|nr:hypothetical protein [Bacteroidaceae bacterium]